MRRLFVSPSIWSPGYSVHHGPLLRSHNNNTTSKISWSLTMVTYCIITQSMLNSVPTVYPNFLAVFLLEAPTGFVSRDSSYQIYSTPRFWDSENLVISLPFHTGMYPVDQPFFAVSTWATKHLFELIPHPVFPRPSGQRKTAQIPSGKGTSSGTRLRTGVALI